MPDQLLNAQLVTRWLDLIFDQHQFQSPRALEFVIENWIGAPQTVGSGKQDFTQIDWYANAAAKQRRQRGFLSAFQMGIYILSLGLVVWILTGRASSLELWALLSINVLPVIAGAFSVFIERSAFSHLEEIYSRMALLSRQTRLRLDDLDGEDPARKIRVLEQFGRESIGEAVDWMITHKIRPLRPEIG